MLVMGGLFRRFRWCWILLEEGFELWWVLYKLLFMILLPGAAVGEEETKAERDRKHIRHLMIEEASMEEEGEEEEAAAAEEEAIRALQVGAN